MELTTVQSHISPFSAPHCGLLNLQMGPLSYDCKRSYITDSHPCNNRSHLQHNREESCFAALNVHARNIRIFKIGVT
ncbi:hypothetical protein L1887_18872 [Cichorium endivia]|nr:hypothetical protein L1887_18872 [Cichorium endivia]